MWLNRTSLDVLQEVRLFDSLKLRMSDRFSIYEANDINLGGLGTFRNDLREGALLISLSPTVSLELGRINLKNGASNAFSPTDYFKTRTTVSQTSIDPSVAKTNRMGALMARLQYLWDSGALLVGFAPKTQESSALTSDPPKILDPLLGQTNGTNRALAALTYELGSLSPQFLFYSEDSVNRFGFSMNMFLSQSVVSYLEWSGSSEYNLSTRALRFGVATGTVPSYAPSAPQADTGQVFGNDLAIGATWASGDPKYKVSVNLEYDYHQSAFTGADFRSWLAQGQSSAAAASLVWYTRFFSSDRQEPLMQHQLFLKVTWDDAFFFRSNLDLAALAFVSPYDLSVLAQLSAQHYLSKTWTLGGFVGGVFGGPDTLYGSLPQRATATLQLIKYL